MPRVTALLGRFIFGSLEKFLIRLLSQNITLNFKENFTFFTLN